MNLNTRAVALAAAALLVSAAATHTQAAAAAPAQAGASAVQTASAAERQFRAWLSVFNAGDRATYEAFIREQSPSRAERIDGDMNMFSMTGGFDLRRIESVTATTVTCLVQERAWEQVARAVVEVEPAPPHRIVRLGLNLVPRPADLAVRRLSEAELAPAARAKIDSAAARGAFSGAVLVARHGTVLYSDAKGLADREAGTLNALETRFRMGSMNKMFTATAVMQLVQAGKVALDTPLGT